MSISDKSRKAMESLGLTGYEIKVYLSLVEIGSMIASDISKNQEFHTLKFTKF
jgi:sugar-specific transcriptional regulator TrmB